MLQLLQARQAISVREGFVPGRNEEEEIKIFRETSDRSKGSEGKGKKKGKAFVFVLRSLTIIPKRGRGSIICIIYRNAQNSGHFPSLLGFRL